MADDKHEAERAPGAGNPDSNGKSEALSSASMSEAQHEEHLARGGVVAGRSRQGMFGASGSGDTSGFGGLRLPAHVAAPSERPYGGWFDEVADELLAAAHERGLPADTVQQITVDRGEITFYLRREHLVEVARILRDDPALRFELCSSVSGVDYGVGAPQRLHSVYHLTSMTYRRRIRLEVAVDVEDPHIPSVVAVYPTADWQERETWDMFGIVYDGHPGLTRILMPDDWDGHPQRKDYPLGGIPVEYKGAEIPPPDQRRSYS
ncbi:NADH-quinone oxidoreductase subunit C [Saccharothrix algeriensis]|uniref:NADH-quinone oxidoreductase subunit C n=1 Tax=Saccharothrix algeriensis TaxID=173560 RepID=A0A8T8HSD7_9PSEU|nr:NADH-quinone oxidoreductase subunit C [Saccharothrix algeriensis]MBM7812625.1 NADH-quinone oxidoreductase subunit C [Saccharothrix algeriensis]QTR01337.1 NADH-quinone oxidoreductase subunit C [Saccharothrix algeriensis]